MTRIDFYISPNKAAEANLQLTCRIVEKAFAKQNRVFIHAKDAEQAQRVDDLLWTFNQGSFIPHCQLSNQQYASNPVVIGYGATPPDEQSDVLVNLDQEVPNFFSRFDRVVEIVSGDENTRSLARNRFKFYRERGYPLESHDLNR